MNAERVFGVVMVWVGLVYIADTALIGEFAVGPVSVAMVLGGCLMVIGGIGFVLGMDGSAIDVDGAVAPRWTVYLGIAGGLVVGSIQSVELLGAGVF